MNAVTKRKWKASLLLAATFVAAMCAAVVVFMLGVYHPFLKDSSSSWWVVLMLAWLLFVRNVHTRLTRRYTTWWDELDAEPEENKRNDMKG